MAKQNLRAVPVEGTVEGVVSDAVSELVGLREEVQEIVENAQGTNFEGSSRISTLSDTADALDCVGTEPDMPAVLSSIPVHYTEDRRKSRRTGRGARCNDCTYRLGCVVEALNEWAGEEGRAEEDIDAVNTLVEAVQEIIDAADGCEWPGMFG